MIVSSKKIDRRARTIYTENQQTEHIRIHMLGFAVMWNGIRTTEIVLYCVEWFGIIKLY